MGQLFKRSYASSWVHRWRDERLPEGPRFGSKSLDADTGNGSAFQADPFPKVTPKSGGFRGLFFCNHGTMGGKPIGQAQGAIVAVFPWAPGFHSCRVFISAIFRLLRLLPFGG